VLQERTFVGVNVLVVLRRVDFFQDRQKRCSGLRRDAVRLTISRFRCWQRNIVRGLFV
jgi:hypothetical protein